MKKTILIGCLGLMVLTWAGTSFGQGCFFDDAAFFTTAVKPNAFILLDRSGSMCWRPQDTYYPCVNGDWGASCGTNYGTPATSKIALATNAIKMILDADSNGVVEDKDSLALQIRIGYGHYYNSWSENDGIAVPYNGDTIGTPYSKLWADASTPVCCNGTPLNHAVWMAMDTMVAEHRREGSTWDCRKMFLIVITDGEDTWGCEALGNSGTPNSRRAGVNVCFTSSHPADPRDSVKVFVIGFGASMPQYLQNTLNWMAYCGGTRNPLASQTGDTTCYPPWNTGNTYQTCGTNSGIDPGNCNLSGYAFIATDSSTLRSALRSIFKTIQQSNGVTFSTPAVPSSFTTSSMLFVNTFDAHTFPTRWYGHLLAYQFYHNGDIPVLSGGGLDPGQFRWDAGNLLRARDITSNPRSLYTPFYTGPGYALHPLNDTTGGGATPDSFGFAPARWDSLKMVVRHAYYDSTSGNHLFGWMGDPFHAGPVDVGPPNPYFSTDTMYSQFASFRRNAPNRRPRRVYLQANDGILHVFNGDTLASNGGGNEICGIVPRHVRPWLRYQLSGHDYNLDGEVISTHVRDSTLTPPLSMPWDQWRTILICAERTGGRYYYAMDVSWPESLAVGQYPKYLWECGPTTANGDSLMGFTFGKAVVCWVMDGTAKRYVAFLPGGYDCNNNGVGKGNFILALDAYKGTLITKIPLTGGGNYGVAAPVRPVDVNYDGLVDRLYVGDVGGNMWRIILDNPTNHAGWHARQMFDPNASAGIYRRPIFGQVSVASDYQNNLWVMWGTGDRNHPDNSSFQNKTALFALRERAQAPDTGTIFRQLDPTMHNANINGCNVGSDEGWYMDLYTSATNFVEVFTNPVTVTDSIRLLVWSPTSSGLGCFATGAGTDSLMTLWYQCGYGHPPNVGVGTGIPPFELAWGVDSRGNVTALLPNLTKRVLGSLNKGKFIRVWREIY